MGTGVGPWNGTDHTSKQHCSNGDTEASWVKGLVPRVALQTAALWEAPRSLQGDLEGGVGPLADLLHCVPHHSVLHCPGGAMWPMTHGLEPPEV